MADFAAQPTPLYRDVLRSCRHRRRATKVVDSTGAELTGGMLLARAFVLRRLLHRHVLGGDERYVGILLPPSAGAVATNLAITFDRRIAVVEICRRSQKIERDNYYEGQEIHYRHRESGWHH